MQARNWSAGRLQVRHQEVGPALVQSCNLIGCSLLSQTLRCVACACDVQSRKERSHSCWHAPPVHQRPRRRTLSCMTPGTFSSEEGREHLSTSSSSSISLPYRYVHTIHKRALVAIPLCRWSRTMHCSCGSSFRKAHVPAVVLHRTSAWLMICLLRSSSRQRARLPKWVASWLRTPHGSAVPN